MRWREAFAKAARTARLMVGVPDYDTYVAHRRAEHPEEPVMSKAEFHRDRIERRLARAASAAAAEARASRLIRPGCNCSPAVAVNGGRFSPKNAMGSHPFRRKSQQGLFVNRWASERASLKNGKDWA